MPAHSYLTLDSRVRVRHLDTGSLRFGTVTALHSQDDPHGNVTILDAYSGEEYRAVFVQLAPRFIPGDRVRPRDASSPLGTVTRACSATVAVEFDDGTGYHGHDSAVDHAPRRHAAA